MKTYQATTSCVSLAFTAPPAKAISKGFLTLYDMATTWHPAGIARMGCNSFVQQFCCLLGVSMKETLHVICIGRRMLFNAVNFIRGSPSYVKPGWRASSSGSMAAAMGGPCCVADAVQLMVSNHTSLMSQNCVVRIQPSRLVVLHDCN